MEDSQNNKEDIIVIGAAQLRIIKIVILVIIFSLPLLYLFYKTSGSAKAPQPPDNNVAQQAVDIQSLENLVQTTPTVVNMLNLSVAYTNNKMPGKSIIVLNRALKLEPNNAMIYNNLGVAYTLLQQYQNGIMACAKAITIDGNFQLAKNNLKWATDENNKVIAAIKLQEQTPDNNRDDSFYYNYANNYFKIGDYDKAISICKQGLNKNSKNVVLINETGIALVFKKDYNNAVTEFNKALQVDPSNQLAKNNLAWALSEKAGN